MYDLVSIQCVFQKTLIMHIFDIEIDINIYIDITLFNIKIILRNTQITKSFCDVQKDFDSA